MQALLSITAAHALNGWDKKLSASASTKNASCIKEYTYIRICIRETHKCLFIQHSTIIVTSLCWRGIDGLVHCSSRAIYHSNVHYTRAFHAISSRSTLTRERLSRRETAGQLQTLLRTISNSCVAGLTNNPWLKFRRALPMLCAVLRCRV